MSFISILLALLLEQARPLGRTNPVHTAVRAWTPWVVRNCDTGTSHHAWLSWAVVVGGPGLLVLVVHWVLLTTLGWAAVAVWNVAVLYVTLGFRQFSYHYTGIRDALDTGDERLARERLATWMGIDASDLPRSEIVRHVIEFSVLSAHRHVFGVFAWYSLAAALGLGPTGAVLYRVSEYFGRSVKQTPQPTDAPISPALQAFTRHAWYLMDWMPARITALSFAFVGSFEEAVDSWRQQERRQPGDNDGVILAATSGAVNVKLGEHDGLGGERVPQAAHLRAVVGMVWRTVVMWMVFLALLSLARLLG